jgi:hypothetical protein
MHGPLNVLGKISLGDGPDGLFCPCGITFCNVFIFMGERYERWMNSDNDKTKVINVNTYTQKKIKRHWAY